MIKQFKDLTGKYNFVFKSELDEALAGTREEPVTTYRPNGNNTAVYYGGTGQSQEKTGIPDDAEVIEVHT